MHEQLHGVTLEHEPIRISKGRWPSTDMPFWTKYIVLYLKKLNHARVSELCSVSRIILYEQLSKNSKSACPDRETYRSGTN